MTRVKTNWDKVKEDYFGDYRTTLEDVAKKHNISYSWVRKKSTNEKWLKQKKKAQERAFKEALRKTEKIMVKKIIDRAKPSLGKRAIS